LNIEELNITHGIAGQLKFFEGKGGLPFIQITNAKARALISIYAGQVLSFQALNESDDLMFLSEKAYYQTGKAIKGGAPICWPWFGAHPVRHDCAPHGFVRNRLWNVDRTEITENGDTKITLKLTDTSETRAIWPQSFLLLLEITVGNSLNLELITRNTGTQMFSITQAFHTYFKVKDINKVRVLGLSGISYIDKTDHSIVKNQVNAVTINGEVDRIYLDVQGETIIEDISLNREIHILSRGNKTSVIWNPWMKISAEMNDLRDNDYKHFLCVETANASSDIIKIEPNREFKLVANYRVSNN